MPELKTTTLYTDSTLKAHYRFESGALTTDSSLTGGHTLTAIGSPTESTSLRFGGAVSLDGNDAYSIVNHADFRPSTAFSVSAVIKTSTTGVSQFIVHSGRYDGTTYSGWSFYITTSNVLRLFTSKNTGKVDGTDFKNITGSTNICDGNEHYVKGVWDGSYLRLYVDGVSDATAVAWANAPAYNATNYVRVGCRSNDGTNDLFVVGVLDEVSLFNGKALSATEVAFLNANNNFFQLF